MDQIHEMVKRFRTVRTIERNPHACFRLRGGGGGGGGERGGGGPFGFGDVFFGGG